MVENYLVLQNENTIVMKSIEHGGLVEFENEENRPLREAFLFFDKLIEDADAQKLNKELELYIVCTLDCNLNCQYCFEKNKRAMYLPLSIVDTIVDFVSCIVKEKGYDSVDITFTGGEPLLAFDKILKLTNLLISNINSAVFSFSVITNGTLLDSEKLSFFEKNKFSLQLSFDGNKEMHDFYRVLKNNNGGTYERLLSKVDLITQVYPNVELLIRVNITNENKLTINELIDDLLPFQKSIMIYPDIVSVSPEDESFIANTESCEVLANVLTYLYENGFSTIHSWSEGSMCMYKNSDGLTIGSDGSLYKCYSLADKDDASFGKIDEIEMSKLCTILEGGGSLCDNSKCAYHALCYGGCPYDAYVSDGIMKKNCKYDTMDYLNKVIFLLEAGQKVDIDQVAVFQKEGMNYKRIN